MDGILCINKPTDYTSFDVIARLRGMSKTKRIGHSGTLDPMATGVLPIFFGKATRACDLLPNDDKRYEAGFKLGITTDTLDSTGTTKEVKESHVKKTEILDILDKFRGDISQIPPMYSAVRINGQRLYDVARQGIEIERAPKNVTIYELELLSFDEAKQEGRLLIDCSKGTYIRSIISDMGDILSVGGIMTALVRTRASVFTLDDCVTLEQVQELTQNGELESRLMPVDRLFESYPKVVLNSVQSDKYKNGVKLDLNRLKYTDIDGFHRVYASDMEFLGLSSLDKADMGLKIEKMFYITPQKV